MNYKDKIELKKEILQDIYECFSFDFLALTDSLDMNKILNIINKYEVYGNVLMRYSFYLNC